ncbi:MAG: hypothetical protein AB2792_01055, partial [Candidatus Thiodiazotropha sp.]
SQIEYQKGEVKKGYPPDQDNETLSSFHLFVSFDLVNFTRTKNAIASLAWIKILSGFYKYFANESRKLDGNLWKLRGDEVILKWEIADAAILPKLLQTLLAASTEFKGTISKKHGMHPDVKMTAWILEVFSEKSIDNIPKSDTPKARNIHFDSASMEMRNSYTDYVGPHMDAGFRLTGCALPTVIVLSVELVYVISKIESGFFNANEEMIQASRKILGELKVVGFKKFKGIGHGAPYPIIWYSEDWDETKDLYYLTAENYEHTLLKVLVAAPNNEDMLNKNVYKKDVYKSTIYYKQIKEDKGFIERLADKNPKIASLKTSTQSG